MKSLRLGISLAALAAMMTEASAATLCDRGAAAALKTAAVQQELMVAGLTCGDSADYNRFVLAFQPELQKSDAALLDWFRNRDGNEAGYDSYKTKLANLAAGKSSADGSRYCAAIRHTFAAANAGGQTLEGFVNADRLLIAAPEACAIQYDVADVAVAGVPAHELPATPYGAAPPPAAPATDQRVPVYPRAPAADPDRRQAYNDLPRPPRYRPARTENDWYGDDAYGPPAYGPSPYGPPAAWLPRPRPWGWGNAYYDD